MSIVRSINEWQEIRHLARQFEGTMLSDAIIDTFAERARASLLVIENPKSPLDIIRVAQGERKAYKCAIMILEDLCKTAERKIPKRQSEVPNA